VVENLLTISPHTYWKELQHMPRVKINGTFRHLEPATAIDILQGAVTTLMLKNLPNRLQVSDVIQKLHELGFADEYDYLYMPRDLQSRANKGYAFVNFTTHQAAKAFAYQVDGKKLHDRMSDKRVAVSVASAQGVVENLLTISHTCWKEVLHMPRVKINGTFHYLEPATAIDMFLESD
jgi:hypothetical protein